MQRKLRCSVRLRASCCRSRPARLSVSRCGTLAAGSLSLRLRTQTAGLRPSWFVSVAPLQAPLLTASALIGITLRRLRDARLPCESDSKQPPLAAWFLALPPVHPRCSARLRAYRYHAAGWAHGRVDNFSDSGQTRSRLRRSRGPCPSAPKSVSPVRLPFALIASLPLSAWRFGRGGFLPAPGQWGGWAFCSPA